MKKMILLNGSLDLLSSLHRKKKEKKKRMTKGRRRKERKRERKERRVRPCYCFCGMEERLKDFQFIL